MLQEGAVNQMKTEMGQNCAERAIWQQGILK